MADRSIPFGALPEVVEIAADADLADPGLRAEAQAALESGQVVLLSDRGFALTDAERAQMLDRPVMEAAMRECERLRTRPTLLFDPQTRTIEASVLPPAERAVTEAMLGRYADWCRELVTTLLPDYAVAFQERITFRPGLRNHAQGLHVDSARLHPTHGRSLLRIFCNIDPRGRPRVWEVGEAFEPMARRFLPPSPASPPLHRRLAERLGLGKPQRSAYDLLMEALHHAVKFDADYQRTAPRKLIGFPSGSTWLAMPDVILHGAVSGQYALDQVFFLPVSAMRESERSSLRILERLSGRRLV